MIEILEIPIFISEHSHIEKYFSAYPHFSLTGDKNYQYITLELENHSMVIVYLLEIKDGKLNTAISDRIIPVAPFCMMLLAGDTFAMNNFHEIYKERYESPLVCIYSKMDTDFDLTYVRNVVLQNNKNLLVEFNPEDGQIIQPILAKSLKHIFEL